MSRNKQQLTFDVDIYPQPGTVVEPARTTIADEPAKPAKKTRPASAPASQQPFLPGLSRRGRPRSPNPIPANVRASESRKRRIAAGMKRVELLLEPEVADQLDALVEHFKVSRVEVLARLIAKAAKRLS